MLVRKNLREEPRRWQEVVDNYWRNQAARNDDVATMQQYNRVAANYNDGDSYNDDGDSYNNDDESGTSSSADSNDDDGGAGYGNDGEPSKFAVFCFYVLIIGLVIGIVILLRRKMRKCRSSDGDNICNNQDFICDDGTRKSGRSRSSRRSHRASRSKHRDDDGRHHKSSQSGRNSGRSNNKKVGPSKLDDYGHLSRSPNHSIRAERRMDDEVGRDRTSRAGSGRIHGGYERDVMRAEEGRGRTRSSRGRSRSRGRKLQRKKSSAKKKKDSDEREFVLFRLSLGKNILSKIMPGDISSSSDEESSSGESSVESTASRDDPMLYREVSFTRKNGAYGDDYGYAERD